MLVNLSLPKSEWPSLLHLEVELEQVATPSLPDLVVLTLKPDLVTQLFAGLVVLPRRTSLEPVCLDQLFLCAPEDWIQ